MFFQASNIYIFLYFYDVATSKNISLCSICAHNKRMRFFSMLRHQKTLNFLNASANLCFSFGCAQITQNKIGKTTCFAIIIPFKCAQKKDIWLQFAKGVIHTKRTKFNESNNSFWIDFNNKKSNFSNSIQNHKFLFSSVSMFKILKCWSILKSDNSFG